MLLNVSERTALLKILPQRAEYEIIKSLKPLKDRLKLTEVEVEEFEFTLDEKTGLFKWNNKGIEGKEIAISPSELRQIKDTLLDLRKEVSEAMMGIWARFML
jgi:hypothetical protein